MICKNNSLINSLCEIDAVLFDLDGTIYQGSKVIDGANQVILFFRERKKKIFFTTNNSTKTRRQIYERLMKMGIDANYSEVITSGYIAAEYALKKSMKDIYIFGSVNLIQEFRDHGISINQNEDAENMLIGYDPFMTYEELTKAVRVAINAKCIMACNKDRVYPGENGKLFPGCGAMTSPVEWCSQKKCDLIIGKPNTIMINFIEEKHSILSSRILVIGDSYESDIAMANKAGCKSILINKNLYDDTTCVFSIKDIPLLF